MFQHASVLEMNLLIRCEKAKDENMVYISLDAVHETNDEFTQMVHSAKNCIDFMTMAERLSHSSSPSILPVETRIQSTNNLNGSKSHT